MSPHPLRLLKSLKKDWWFYDDSEKWHRQGTRLEASSLEQALLLSNVILVLKYVALRLSDVEAVLGEVVLSHAGGKKLSSRPLPRAHFCGTLGHGEERPLAAGRKMTLLLFSQLASCLAPLTKFFKWQKWRREAEVHI